MFADFNLARQNCSLRTVPLRKIEIGEREVKSVLRKQNLKRPDPPEQFRLAKLKSVVLIKIARRFS
ncbi:MAG: hypothetical protein GY820_28190 [Gammaproteobacteria bacterium]|nr:hypothetical protein [Gammaproteobacteria bacterium]